MALFIVFAGIVLVVIGLNNQLSAASALLKEDFAPSDGSISFSIWIVAILLVGAVGYYKPAKPFSNAFLLLIFVMIILTSKSGFITNLNSSITNLGKGSTNTTNASTSGGSTNTTLNSLFSNLTLNTSGVNIPGVSSISNAFANAVPNTSANAVPNTSSANSRGGGSNSLVAAFDNNIANVVNVVANVAENYFNGD